MHYTALLIPATKVPDSSRELEKGDFMFLVSQLREGEKLVGLYQRGDFWTAPWLHSADEHQGFERHVRVGLMECLGYYAIPDESFEELVVM